MENYGRLDKVTKLVNERVFYLFPTVNPDGRDYFMKGPSGVSARGGHMPTDSDNDGLVDSDDIMDLKNDPRPDPQVCPWPGQLSEGIPDPMMELVPREVETT
jgi:hypothetical protein